MTTKRGGNLPKYAYRDPEGSDYRKAVLRHWAKANQQFLAALLREHGDRPLDAGQKAWAAYWKAKMAAQGQVWQDKIEQPQYDALTDTWR